jgi:hypothetical protein
MFPLTPLVAILEDLPEPAEEERPSPSFLDLAPDRLGLFFGQHAGG